MHGPVFVILVLEPHSWVHEYPIVGAVHLEYVHEHTLVLWHFYAYDWKIPNVLLVVYYLVVFFLLSWLLFHFIHADDLEWLGIASHVGKMLPELTKSLIHLFILLILSYV